MKRFITIATGIILGFTPLGAAALIGIVAYDALPNTLGLIIVVIIALSALWTGYEIFMRVQDVGPIKTMSAIQASSELDNLKPVIDNKEN